MNDAQMELPTREEILKDLTSGMRKMHDARSLEEPLETLRARFMRAHLGSPLDGPNVLTPDSNPRPTDAACSTDNDRYPTDDVRYPTDDNRYPTDDDRISTDDERYPADDKRSAHKHSHRFARSSIEDATCYSTSGDAKYPTDKCSTL